MQLIRKIALCFAATFCLPAILIAIELPTAAPESVGLSAEKLQDARAAMQKLVDEKRIAGGVLAVARRGRVVQFEACGMMDIEAGKPMKRDTIFRFYSMSKPITTVASMILYEQGKIKLDDPVSKYIPEFKELKVVADPDADVITEVAPKRQMSVRDLMRHTSGLKKFPRSGRVCKIHFAHAGEITVMSLCQITDESLGDKRNFFVNE